MWRRSDWCGWAQEALRDRRGGALIEFALVAMPFLYLMFAILEIGMVFTANTSLANATFNLSRQLRVGSLLAAGKAITTSNGTQMNLADFKAAICKAMVFVPTTSCANQIQIDLRTQTSFASNAAPVTGSGTNFDASQLCFYSGASGDIVVLRAYYLWPVQTPLLLTPLAKIKSITGSANAANGDFFLFQTAEIFRNEPSSVTNNGAGC